jgi:predicted transcriptional regulator
MSDKRKQGELEAEVLECLWSRPKGCSSQQILSLLGPSLKLTTVLTVLSRLEDKGLVEKKPGVGRSYVFYAKTSREQYIASQLLAILKKSSAGVFDHLAAGLSSKQVAQLKRALGD